MKTTRLFMLVALLAAALTAAKAQGPNGSGTYYQNADGKKAAALKTAMYNLISQHINIGYNGLWNAYQKTDKRADGYVRDWYSNITNYVFGTDQAGTYKKEGDCYNREHTVPQSWFSEASPMKADIVHVVPTDGYINGIRGDLPFGEVSTINYASANNYSKRGSCRTAGYNSTVFEPNDEIKGDIARIYFYMVTCYQDKINSWSGESFSGSGLASWTLDMMMRWSKEDPVDDIETARNNAVYEVQQNRNPFVDYPGLEDYIWGNKQSMTFSYSGGAEVVTVAMPVFQPEGGTYYDMVDVDITCATDGATIYYTTNGAAPSEQSQLYEGTFTLSESATVKAIAVKDGVYSEVASATYVITTQGGGGEVEDPTEGIDILLCNQLFGTSYSGAMSTTPADLVGTQNGVTITYALGSGSNRYCNDSQIRLYQNNQLTFSVAEGTLTGIEFQLAAATSKTLSATNGTIADNTVWTGNAQSVTFSVNEGSGNMQLKGCKVKVSGQSTAIQLTETPQLSRQRVVYNLRGQRVANPTRGLYIVDGRKVFIP